VQSGSGAVYEVEIRDLAGRGNSCGCVDHRVNGLGTCKHIEGVLSALKKKLGVRGFAAAATEGPQRIEVYLRREGRPAPSLGGPSPAGDRFSQAVHLQGRALKSEPDSIARLLSIAAKAPPEIRVSRHFGPWIERERRLATREKAREKFLSEVAAGSASLDVVKFPLLPYQREGAAHLTFHERALLADEMGLGKTIQAIAACEILARAKGRRTRARRLAYFCQSGMGGADRALHE
jgi:hypothetical protein